MKYFLISNHEFVKHRPEINQINLLEYKDKQIWTCALHQIEPFIIKTYNFNQYIFVITYDEIDLIQPFLADTKIKHIIIKDCTDKREALYKLNTDINLSIKVYFL